MIDKIVKCNEPALPPNYKRDNKSVFYNSSGEVNSGINFIGDTLNHDLEYIGAPGGTEDNKDNQQKIDFVVDPTWRLVDGKLFRTEYIHPYGNVEFQVNKVIGEGPITKARIRRLLEKLNYTYMGRGLMKYSGNSKTDGVEGILSLHLSHKLIASIGILLKLNITFTKNYMVEVFDMVEHKLNNGIVLI